MVVTKHLTMCKKKRGIYSKVTYVCTEVVRSEHYSIQDIQLFLELQINRLFKHVPQVHQTHRTLHVSYEERTGLQLSPLQYFFQLFSELLKGKIAVAIKVIITFQVHVILQQKIYENFFKFLVIVMKSSQYIPIKILQSKILTSATVAKLKQEKFKTQSYC